MVLVSSTSAAVDGSPRRGPSDAPQRMYLTRPCQRLLIVRPRGWCGGPNQSMMGARSRAQAWAQSTLDDGIAGARRDAIDRSAVPRTRRWGGIHLVGGTD